MIIAIDGPSGAGKSTLGRMLAHEVGLLYIDTGAMYRAVALAVIEQGISLTDQRAVTGVAKHARVDLAGDPNSLQVKLNGRDITVAIRTAEIGRAASVISTIPEVRRELVYHQREMGTRGSVVLDGRDIGTVVFPDADIKFFLTATPEQRAHRRYDEDRARTNDVSFEATFADINARDERDSTRADSPLAIAEDAVVIDSTELSIEEVFERMVAVVRERQMKEVS
ncbi:MAG: (d)CMP kinase [Pyrinomonadaceae bacterium]|nr:(d)CMP kinase [Pyrinomonadaceae bacterium]